MTKKETYDYLISVGYTYDDTNVISPRNRILKTNICVKECRCQTAGFAWYFKTGEVVTYVKHLDNDKLNNSFENLSIIKIGSKQSKKNYYDKNYDKISKQSIIYYSEKKIEIRSQQKIYYSETKKEKVIKYSTIKQPKIVSNRSKTLKYINDTELTYEIIISQGKGKLTNKATSLLILLANKLSNKFVYYNETDRNDCINEAICRLLQTWQNYKTYKKSVPYFTEIAKRSMAKCLNLIKGDKMGCYKAPKFSSLDYKNYKY